MNEEDPSRCPECDGQYLWAGMSWSTAGHTAAFHERRRQDWLKALRVALYARFCARLGHVITLRFAGKQAWYECACDQRGDVLDHIGSARVQARQHLSAGGEFVINTPLLEWLRKDEERNERAAHRAVPPLQGD